MTAGQNIAQNTAYLTTALVVQKIIAYFFFLVIASVLGADGTGEYVAAFSFAGLFSVLVDLGLSNVLVREIARHPERSGDYLQNVVGLKLFLGGIAYILLLTTIIILGAFGADHPSLELVAVAGIAMFLDSMVLSGNSVFRGWQNLRMESVVVVVQKIGILIAGLLALWWFSSAFSLAVAILVGGTFAYWLITKYLRDRIKQPWRPKFDWHIQKKLLKIAWPFALAAFFAVGYAHIDSILLSVLKGNSAVGLYSVASKTMNAFVFIPSAFVAAIYPAMSEAYGVNKERLTELTHVSLRFLLMIGAPVAMGLFLLAEPFVSLIGSDYIESVLAVKLLIPSLAFMFLTYPIGSFLNATNRQTWQTAILGIGLVGNIALNIYLIPQYSFIGASIAWSLTNVLMFVIGLILVSRVVDILNARLLISVARILLAVLAMAGIVVATVNYFVLVPIVLGALVYGVILFVLREITINEIIGLVKLFKHVKR
jgi:O-antigen/teichoic acid export membrane protein